MLTHRIPQCPYCNGVLGKEISHFFRSEDVQPEDAPRIGRKHLGALCKVFRNDICQDLN